MSITTAMMICVLRAAAAGQPQDGGNPRVVFTAMDPAPGIPWSGHVMLPPEHGVILGCWADGYPASFTRTTGCYWLVATGERVDLTDPILVDGVEYWPRYPEPGIDPATGATVWNCRSASGDRLKTVIVIPGVAKSADFNGDGKVNTLDHLDYLNAWSEQRER